MALRFLEKSTVVAGINVFPWAIYAGSVRRALELLKYGGRPELGDWLGERLGRWWLAQPLWRAARVMAVPLHPERQARRGYNQAERIARSFSARSGIGYRGGLERHVATAALHDLGAAARQAQLQSAFRFRGQLDGRPTLLIDDICTSGATLAGCAAALQAAGGGPVAALVVARPLLYRQANP